MKKVIYSLSIALVATFTSCGEAKSKESLKDIKEELELAKEELELVKEEVIDEDVLEEGVIMVNGLQFFGNNEFELNSSGVSVDEMYAAVMETGTFEGLVKAEISEVCKKAGCWITVLKEDGSTVRVIFRDHFGIPTDTPAGYEVLMNGVGQVDTTSIELQKHFLDDAKEAGEEVSQADYDAITEDLIEVSFDCDGLLVPPTE
jgi:hypothetical protein